MSGVLDFGGQEGSSKEIVLYRVLRGCGMHWQQSGFLDFAIALEAALLSGTTSEHSYRFSLYGALFLRDGRDPRRTFDQLHNIYMVRSKLVHGSRVNATHRIAAEADAAELALAVVRKAVETGWPDAEVLNQLAFEG
jgi:Apea-like HEPN